MRIVSVFPLCSADTGGVWGLRSGFGGGPWSRPARYATTLSRVARDVLKVGEYSPGTAERTASFGEKSYEMPTRRAHTTSVHINTVVLSGATAAPNQPEPRSQEWDHRSTPPRSTIQENA